MSEFERLLDETLAVGMGDEYFQPWSKGLEVAHAALFAYHERVVQEAERYRALKESVDDGELIVCYTDHHDGGDIGGPECIDDWCDARIEMNADAARKGVSDER